MRDERCPICDSSDFNHLFESTNQPLARYGLAASLHRAQAAPCNDLSIVACRHCGCVFNAKYDPSNIDYTSDQVLESTQFSPSIKKYNQKKSNDLSGIINLKGKCVLEIGCGEGSFLSNFQESYTVGYDPSQEYKNSSFKISCFVNDYFDPEQPFDHPNPSLVIMRQVLEHLSSPKIFLHKIFNLLSSSEDHGYLYLEVPNSRPTFENMRLHDFYYDHYAYYDSRSIHEILTRSGFNILQIAEEHHGEILSILAKPRIDHQADLLDNHYNQVRSSVLELVASGKKVVGWGAAGNGSSFLNQYRLGSDIISCVIDSDARKQGLYIPGTGQPIVSPESQVSEALDIIIVFSQLHRDDIARHASSLFGDVKVITPQELR